MSVQTPAVPTTRDRARFKDGPYVELSPRRVRAFVSGVPIVDSRRVLLVYESRRPPVYWFPTHDVRMDLLAAKEPASSVDSTSTHWRLEVAGRVVDNAAWSYPQPAPGLEVLHDHIALHWNAMDAWFEEDDQVFVHPRDPYTRVDVHNSSRHVKVVVDGQVVAETRRPRLLFETGLVTRYYIPKLDVRMDLLEPTDLHTSCPYKGVASYWTLRAGDQLHENLVWSYPAPTPEVAKIENLLSFYNEQVDLYVDGELQPH